MPINRQFTAHGDYAKALRQTHVAHKKKRMPLMETSSIILYALATLTRV